MSSASAGNALANYACGELYSQHYCGDLSAAAGGAAGAGGLLPMGLPVGSAQSAAVASTVSAAAAAAAAVAVSHGNHSRYGLTARRRA